MAPPARVVDEADELINVWELCISSHVYNELVRDFLLPEICACHLCLNDRSLARKEEVGARGITGITRHPFFRADVVEVQLQNSMKQVLHIVFVLNCNRLAATLARLHFLDEEMETPAQDNDLRHRISFWSGLNNDAVERAPEMDINAGSFSRVIRGQCLSNYSEKNFVFGGRQIDGGTGGEECCKRCKKDQVTSGKARQRRMKGATHVRERSRQKLFGRSRCSLGRPINKLPFCLAALNSFGQSTAMVPICAGAFDGAIGYAKQLKRDLHKGVTVGRKEFATHQPFESLYPIALDLVIGSINHISKRG